MRKKWAVIKNGARNTKASRGGRKGVRIANQIVAALLEQRPDCSHDEVIYGE